jgi:hypothetical protein
MTKVRVATTIPRQHWKQAEKLAWLDKALSENSCDLLLSSQEVFGGGSMRELCRMKGIETDDVPVSPEWLAENIGNLCKKHNVHIGIGATVNRNGINTEDYTYFDRAGKYLGHHSKIALPVQDSIINGGASQVTPETDLERAASVIALPELGIRVGTIFCWQIFFNDFFTLLRRNKCNLAVNCIKFSPRSWYKKDKDAAGFFTRVGFAQETCSSNAADDSLGWIDKLKFESRYKEFPIAVTCNTWNGGTKYLALVGWVDEVTGHTKLENLPSTAETERVIVTEYDPTLYDELEHLSLGVYARFKGDWAQLMKGTMRRKAMRIEQRAKSGKTAEQLAKYIAKPPKPPKPAPLEPEPFNLMFEGE